MKLPIFFVPFLSGCAALGETIQKTGEIIAARPEIVEQAQTAAQTLPEPLSTLATGVIGAVSAILAYRYRLRLLRADPAKADL